MLARPFAPAEHMADVFDRASTLHFTTVAVVQGARTLADLRAQATH